MKVAVIFGGISTEHEVSIMSAKNVIDNLDKNRYKIYPVFIDKNGIWMQDSKRIKDIVSFIKEMDVVFPVLHGRYGEDGTIQGMLEILKVPYVGCKVLSSSICMDKLFTKYVLEKANINQAKYIYIKNENLYVNEELEETKLENDEIVKLVAEKLNFPVFVKPANSGSSVGVKKANNGPELIVAIQNASIYDTKILIEEEIVGKEVECAVLGTNSPEVSSVGEIISADTFYTYDAKYNNKESETKIPANLDNEKINEIRRLAVKAFKSLECTGLARVDFFVQKDTNKVYLNEINTMPGFTEISMYPKLWEYSGLKYKELLDKLIEYALENVKS